ncbi:hypothetical protein GCM10010399_17180 [Dactylosporangium fulvum]
MGALSAAALTAYTGEPVSSSAAGAALGAVLDDIGERMLSKREQRRVKTVVTHAARSIKQRWVEGHDLREDGFFAADTDSRSFFEEITEGVLLAAQREYQERKLPYLGNLIANVAYTPNIDRASANWAVRTASELGWTQYMLLSTVGRESISLPDVEIGKSNQNWHSWSIHHELHDLSWTRSLVGAPPLQTESLRLTKINTNAAAMRLNSGGTLLFHLLELNEVPLQELEDLLNRMTREAPEEGPAT